MSISPAVFLTLALTAAVASPPVAEPAPVTTEATKPVDGPPPALAAIPADAPPRAGAADDKPAQAPDQLRIAYFGVDERTPLTQAALLVWVETREQAGKQGGGTIIRRIQPVSGQDEGRRKVSHY